MFGPRATLGILRQLAGFRRGEVRPVFCTWHVTRRCNLRCGHCFFNHRMRDLGEDLDTAACLGVVDQIVAARIPVVYFAGGEPTSRPDLVDIAGRVHRAGIFTILFTNGTLITPELAARLAGVFDAAYVSIDGPLAVHEQVRGTGSFGRGIDGLRALLAHRDRLRVGINTVVNAEGAEQLPELLRQARELGVHGVQIHPEFHPPTRVDAAGRDALVDRFRRLRREFPGLIETDEDYQRRAAHYLSEDWQRECEADSLLHVAILPDGQLSACCAFPMPLGDLRVDTLAQILARGRPDPSCFAECPGCFRRDYRVARDLVERPWSVVRQAGARLLARIPAPTGGRS
jgi:MoaA/NifB/PqqE/SkfB family radical SAM enzyme